MAVLFLLLVVVVQAALLVVARQAAQAAVDAAARRAARWDGDAATAQERLAAELASVVPGATDVEAEVRRGPTTATATAALGWSPPGPDLVPVTIRVVARAAVVRGP